MATLVVGSPCFLLAAAGWLAFQDRFGDIARQLSAFAVTLVLYSGAHVAMLLASAGWRILWIPRALIKAEGASPSQVRTLAAGLTIFGLAAMCVAAFLAYRFVNIANEIFR